MLDFKNVKHEFPEELISLIKSVPVRLARENVETRMVLLFGLVAAATILDKDEDFEDLLIVLKDARKQSKDAYLEILKEAHEQSKDAYLELLKTQLEESEK